MRGVNCDPLNSAGSPAPADIRAFGFDSVRFVLRNTDETRDYARRCQARGLSVLGVVTNQTLETYGAGPSVPLSVALIDQREQAIRRAIDRALDEHAGLVAVECGNEPDGEGPSSWKMDEPTWVRFHNLCADEVFARGLTICTAGLVSGQSSFAARNVNDLSFDVMLVHPYAKTPEEGRRLMREYRDIVRPFHKKIGASEWFRDGDEVAAFSAMLEEEHCFADIFFCWSDGMVAGFGLHDGAGGVKAVGIALTNHLQTGGALAAMPAALLADGDLAEGISFAAKATNGASNGAADSMGEIVATLRKDRLSKKTRLEIAKRLERLSRA
jgi:hypothetical protein